MKFLPEVANFYDNVKQQTYNKISDKTEYWLGNLKEGDCWQDLGIGGMITLR